MKEYIISFDEEDVELIESQFENEQQMGISFDSIEDYIAYSALSHCKTMHIASKMFKNSEFIDDFQDSPERSDHIQIGVVNMDNPMNDDDKEEFAEYLNDVLNKAVKDFQNRNDEEPLN